MTYPDRGSQSSQNRERLNKSRRQASRGEGRGKGSERMIIPYIAKAFDKFLFQVLFA